MKLHLWKHIWHMDGTYKTTGSKRSRPHDELESEGLHGGIQDHQSAMNMNHSLGSVIIVTKYPHQLGPRRCPDRMGLLNRVCLKVLRASLAN
jgi:hypothetical protein